MQSSTQLGCSCEAKYARKSSPTCRLQQGGDDFVGVALVDEELLALGGEVHLLRYGSQRDRGQQTAEASSRFQALVPHARSKEACSHRHQLPHTGNAPPL